MLATFQVIEPAVLEEVFVSVLKIDVRQLFRLLVCWRQRLSGRLALLGDQNDKDGIIWAQESVLIEFDFAVSWPLGWVLGLLRRLRELVHVVLLSICAEHDHHHLSQLPVVCVEHIRLLVGISVFLLFAILFHIELFFGTGFTTDEFVLDKVLEHGLLGLWLIGPFNWHRRWH